MGWMREEGAMMRWPQLLDLIHPGQPVDETWLARGSPLGGSTLGRLGGTRVDAGGLVLRQVRRRMRYSQESGEMN